MAPIKSRNSPEHSAYLLFGGRFLSPVPSDLNPNVTRSERFSPLLCFQTFFAALSVLALLVCVFITADAPFQKSKSLGYPCSPGRTNCEREVAFMSITDPSHKEDLK